MANCWETGRLRPGGLLIYSCCSDSTITKPVKGHTVLPHSSWMQWRWWWWLAEASNKAWHSTCFVGVKLFIFIITEMAAGGKDKLLVYKSITVVCTGLVQCKGSFTVLLDIFWEHCVRHYVHRQNTGLTSPIPSLQSSLSRLNSTTTPANDTAGAEPAPQSTFVCYIFALLYLLFASCQWLWCGLTDITKKLPIFDTQRPTGVEKNTHTLTHDGCNKVPILRSPSH